MHFDFEVYLTKSNLQQKKNELLSKIFNLKKEKNYKINFLLVVSFRYLLIVSFLAKIFFFLY